MSVRETNGLADQIEKKLHMTLKKYCELRGISIHSMHSKYLSEKTLQILQDDGIDLDIVKDIRVARYSKFKRG